MEIRITKKGEIIQKPKLPAVSISVFTDEIWVQWNNATPIEKVVEVYKEKTERVKMIKLKERYRVLGELEDLFPRTSTHKAATEIKRLRDETIKEIEKLKGNE